MRVSISSDHSTLIQREDSRRAESFSWVRPKATIYGWHERVAYCALGRTP